MSQINKYYIMSSIDSKKIKQCYKIEYDSFGNSQLKLFRIGSSYKPIAVYGYLYGCLLAYLEDKKTSDSDTYQLFDQWEYNVYDFKSIIELTVEEDHVQTLLTYEILDAQVLTYDEILSYLNMSDVINNLDYYQNIYKVKAFAIPEYSSPIFSY